MTLPPRCSCSACAAGPWASTSPRPGRLGSGFKLIAWQLITMFLFGKRCGAVINNPNESTCAGQLIVVTVHR
jgi:hypothetical protein